MNVRLRFREAAGRRQFRKEFLPFICFVCVRVYRLICPLFFGGDGALFFNPCFDTDRYTVWQNGSEE